MRRKKKKERKKMKKSDFFGGLFLSSHILKGTFASVMIKMITNLGGGDMSALVFLWVTIAHFECCWQYSFICIADPAIQGFLIEFSFITCTPPAYSSRVATLNCLGFLVIQQRIRGSDMEGE